MVNQSDIEKLERIGFTRFHQQDTSDSICYQCGDMLCQIHEDGMIDICLYDITVMGRGNSLKGALEGALELLNKNTKQAKRDIKQLLHDVLES